MIASRALLPIDWEIVRALDNRPEEIRHSRLEIDAVRAEAIVHVAGEQLTEFSIGADLALATAERWEDVEVAMNRWRSLGISLTRGDVETMYLDAWSSSIQGGRATRSATTISMRRSRPNEGALTRPGVHSTYPMTRLTVTNLLVVAALGFSVAGCGESTSTPPAEETPEVDFQRAVDAFNGGNGPIVLRDSGGARLDRCGIVESDGEALLTVTARDGTWVQALIDPETGVGEGDINFGQDMESAMRAQGRTVDELFAGSRDCTVSSTGTVQLP